MSFVSYSQNMEDILLWRALQQVEEGFYIDVGAADPEEWSVTRAFYDRGWSGINVEPLGEYFQRLVEQRQRDQNIRAVLGEKAGVVKFHAIPGTGLSTLDDAIAARHKSAGWTTRTEYVPRLTLTSVMEERGAYPIHFLKIDVEGAERAVLEGADLSRFRPWVIVIESTAPLSPEDTRGDWEDLVTSQRYTLAIFDGLNCFYVAEEHSELIDLFSVPVNVFDDYVRASEQHTVNALAHAQADAAQQREQVAIAQTKHTEAMTHLQAEREAFESRLAAMAGELATTTETQRVEHKALVKSLQTEADTALATERTQHRLKLEALMRDQNEVDYLRSRLADSERRADAADRDRKSLRLALIETQRVQSEVCEEYLKLREDYLGLREAASRLDWRLKATLASHSWRMTGAVRGASRLVRNRPSEDAELAAADQAISRILALPMPAVVSKVDADDFETQSELSPGAQLILRRLQVRGAHEGRC